MFVTFACPQVRSLFLDNWEPELIAVMRNLGNRLGGTIFEATAPPPRSGSPTASINSVSNNSSSSNSKQDALLLTDDITRPQPGQGSVSNKQVRQAWIEMKYTKGQFVDFPGSSLADLKSRILELHRTWRSQMHTASPGDHKRIDAPIDHSVSPVLTILSTQVFGRVAKVVDRRRPSASPRLVKRSQMFLGDAKELVTGQGVRIDDAWDEDSNRVALRLSISLLNDISRFL
ncbi:unnamed protein product [Dibothriocephalus latus]|uniref:Uncharacterized protein n=1 Tax=Dibothriocephalus latus TaxID=60516 RepID=A0A3P6PQJ3_DIBLA|nr:unnamed protein product [Dibothriocephalus latus]